MDINNQGEKDEWKVDFKPSGPSLQLKNVGLTRAEIDSNVLKENRLKALDKERKPPTVIDQP